MSVGLGPSIDYEVRGGTVGSELVRADAMSSMQIMTNGPAVDLVRYLCLLILGMQQLTLPSAATARTVSSIPHFDNSNN